MFLANTPMCSTYKAFTMRCTTYDEFTNHLSKVGITAYRFADSIMLNPKFYYQLFAKRQNSLTCGGDSDVIGGGEGKPPRFRWDFVGDLN